MEPKVIEKVLVNDKINKINACSFHHYQSLPRRTGAHIVKLSAYLYKVVKSSCEISKSLRKIFKKKVRAANTNLRGALTDRSS